MFDKIISPTTNFNSVRDGRNSQIFYADIDLSTSRSASAGTGLVLNIAGNSFYVDANPSDGNALVHFQDTNFDRAPSPLYVSPGTIFNIPFTQILIENTAQAGKKIRVVYGVDVDFQPGSVAQVSLNGSISDDYITKSLAGQNYAVYGNFTAGAAIQSFWALKNIGSTNYRLNDLVFSTPSPDASAIRFDFLQYRTFSSATPTAATSTKTGSQINVVYGPSTTAPAFTTQFNLSAMSGKNNGNFIGKSPVIIEPGNAVALVFTNNTAGTLGGAFWANFDIL